MDLFSKFCDMYMYMIFLQNVCDVVGMDWRMNGLDGMEIEEIRCRK